MAKFYEYYKGEVSEFVLRSESQLYLSEISSGVYVAEKDRYGDFDSDTFVSSALVAKYMNNREKVVIERLDGLWVSNYDFLERGNE